MAAFVKDSLTIVVENISSILENVNGRNYIRFENGTTFEGCTTIEVTNEEVTEIKKLL